VPGITETLSNGGGGGGGVVVVVVVVVVVGVNKGQTKASFNRLRLRGIVL
jgi:hypothetical protein